MAYTSDQIRQYAVDNGFANQQGQVTNPWGLYTSAQKYGVTADQLDQAGGWASGTAQNWINQNGLASLGGGQPASAPAAVGGMSGGASPTQSQASSQPTQYGYAQAPGGNYGYYEQQTPMGSFAAANQQYARGAAPVNQQTAYNPYIGQAGQGIGGQSSVMPYAQKAGEIANKANPYVGGTTQQSAGAGTNPYAGSNPYLGQMIDAASQDVTKNFNSVIRPRLDSLARASGSFGNSGVQEAEQNAYSDLSKQLGNIASGMRFQDYTTQQGLAENALNRTQANNQFNSGLSAGDLNRNLSGWLGTQNLGLAGVGQQLGAAQFDASLGNNVNQFNAGLGQADLSRNANLAQNLGQFNAGQGNSLGLANAQMAQNNNQFNASQGNALNQFNTGQGNQMLSQQRSLNQNMDQFNQGMDFQTWQANNQNMRQGTLDQINLINSVLGWNNMGLGLANQQQNTPLNYWQQFSNGFNQAGGLGGSNSQQMYGNPWLGALGGWMGVGQLFGNGGAPQRTGG